MLLGFHQFPPISDELTLLRFPECYCVLTFLVLELGLGANCSSAEAFVQADPNTSYNKIWSRGLEFGSFGRFILSLNPSYTAIPSPIGFSMPKYPLKHFQLYLKFP